MFFFYTNHQSTSRVGRLVRQFRRRNTCETLIRCGNRVGPIRPLTGFFYRVFFLFISLGQLPVSRFVIGASIPGAASGFDLKGLDFLKQNFYLILFRCFFFVDVVERNDERSGKRLRKASAGAVSAAKRPFYANDVAIYDDAIPIDSAPSFAFLSLILSFSHSLFLYLSFVVVVVVADVVGAGVTEFE